MNFARVALMLGTVMGFSSCSASAFCSTDFAGQSDYPYKFYQTKTLYDTVRGNISTADRAANCTPKAIVMFLRHGSRHPGADEVKDYEGLADLVKRINATGTPEQCSQDLERIRSWINWHQPAMDKDLAVTGYNEMKGLSERYSSVFPEIFTSSASYRFIASKSKRTQQSSEAFIDGLAKTGDRPETEVDNVLTRFFDYCPRYLTEVDENDTVVEDVDAFMEGPVIQEIAAVFARRLGIPPNEVDTNVVNTARKEGCAEEEWATGNNSAWCLAFSKQELQAFEYGEDMEDYLVKSFAFEINYKQSCGTKRFLLSALRNASTSESHSGHFLFSHSTGLMSLLTELRAIKNDGPLRSTDYPEKINRTFRASMYTPGSGNIAFILYDCQGEMKIQMFLNEKLLRMPLDGDNGDVNGLWNFESALDYFGYYDPADCQLSKLCAYPDSVTDSPPATTSVGVQTAQSLWFTGTWCLVAMGYNLNF